MDSIGRPVGEDPQDPYNKYRANEIQKDKQAKEEAEKNRQTPQKSMFGAYLLHLVHKFLELFEDTNEKGLTTSAQEEVKNHLNQLKQMLETLKVENRSQDSPFLNELSKIWHEILEDSLRFKNKTLLSRNFRAFIKEIQHYPKTQDHTLGYYLIEYAGQKWLPFPYMELIQKIHMDHQNNPNASALAEWTKRIDELVAAFSE